MIVTAHVTASERLGYGITRGDLVDTSRLCYRPTGIIFRQMNDK